MSLFLFTALTRPTLPPRTQGKRFRSRAEIARHFELEAAPAKREGKGAEAKGVEAKAKVMTAAEKAAAAEAKRLAAVEAKRAAKEAAEAKRKAEERAAMLAAQRYPITDDRLPFEEPAEPPLPPRPEALAVDLSPIAPADVGELLAVADFLRAVRSTSLQLPSYSSVYELLYELTTAHGVEPPARLCELCQALLTLILADERAKTWWPNPATTSVERSKALPKKIGAKKGGAEGGGGGGGGGGGKKKWWEMDAKPIVKCNLEAVLKGNEPPSVTRSWVAIIETITPMRTNTGFPIKEAVEYAQRAAKDLEVKKYLARALRYFKGNAAGTTKFAALWLAAQVRRHKPEMWTLEAMQAPDPQREGEATTPPHHKGQGEEGAEVGAALAELEEEEEEEDEDAAAAAAAAAEAALAEVDEEGAEDEEGEEAGVGHEVDGAAGDAAGGGGGVAGSTAGGASSSAPVAEAMEVEGEAASLPIGATQMALLSSDVEVDSLLWEGAAAEGWRVRRLEFAKLPAADIDAEGSSGSGRGGGGGRGGNVVDEFLGPSKNVYVSLSAAVDARAAEDALSVRASVAANPSILVGWRVFVFWSGSEQNELGGRGGWFGAQVVGWREVVSATEADGGGKQGGHSLVYDDMSTEEVDLTSVKYQLGYPLLSAQLQPGRRAPRPEL